MSQSQIIELLEKQKKPLSRGEIALELNIEVHHVSNIIQRLINHNEIKFKELTRIEAKEIYGEKAPFRRLRVYYI